MSLKEIRKKIDQIDESIIELLEKRFELCLFAKKYKDKIKDKKREKEILNKSPSKYIKNIFKEILKSSKKILHKNSKDY